ncbi:MAG TPA: HAD-IA family hydrolase [Acidimicrobiales bacterium]|nr:HAD-IA family hydrolase [Acidimicrobiales bacterium]
MLTLSELDAVLFDLDGVLTDTASLHQAAWTETFDQLFDHIAARSGGRDRPTVFSGDDYRRLVDGEPRLDGVLHVLDDRRIALPEGQPSDPAGLSSAWAVATKKDERFTTLLKEHGPQVFEGAEGLLECLHAAGVSVAVVSASRHCHDVLAQAGLAPFVDVVVDAQVAAAMALRGKPDPAVYLEAARRLGVDPAHAAVVEDAIAGVAAGHAGRFHTVVGVDHHHRPEALLAAGARLVVEDLRALELVGPGPLTDGWHLDYRPVHEHGEGMRETLLTLANGYFGTRGAATWAQDDGTHYPGTYLAGLYNRLDSDVLGGVVERESMVRAPNWLPLTFSADGGPYLGEPGVEVSHQELRLDLRCGVLRRRYRVVDPDGRRSTVTERRLVSMANPHLAALQVELVAENWSGTLSVRSGIDATGCADQTTEARLLSHCHLSLVSSGEDSGGAVWLAARTTQSDVLVAEATRTSTSTSTRTDQPSGLPVFQRSPNAVAHEWRIPIVAGARCCVEKVTAIYTCRDRAISDPIGAARRACVEAPGFVELVAAQRAAWARLWSQAAIEITAAGRPAGIVNLHLYHVLQVATPAVADLDCGLGARGLHGEGYDGHVFWDELFVFPILNLRFPRSSRALLRYRGRRLGSARRLAVASGEVGARFPWQSASDGSDVTPTMLFNPRSGHWVADRSSHQRHVGLAVAYNYWQHWQTTGDDAFFFGEGAEVVVEVARHFAYLASYDEQLDRYHLRGVMGPDEFHDGYPWTDTPGIDDNAYTNVLAAWLCARVVELAERLTRQGRGDVLAGLGVDDEELLRLDHVSRRLSVPFHEGVISQFAGYERLEPIDLDAYRSRYANIGRLDLILEAEGDTVRRYQVAKQADTLMLFYLFSLSELREVFARLGYELTEPCVENTIAYYTARTTHGSTLSKVVHAWVTARSDRRASWHQLTGALAADMADIQGGTTREGIHLGAMAGTIDLLGRCYSGLEVRADMLVVEPALPEEIERMGLTMTYRGHRLDLQVDHDEVVVTSAAGAAAPITVLIGGKRHTLRPAGRLCRPLPGAIADPGRSGTHIGPLLRWGALGQHRRSRPVGTAPTPPAQPHKEETMATTTDPVCGMTIEESAAAGSAVYEGITYSFCSAACQERFEADPATYASGDR